MVGCRLISWPFPVIIYWAKKEEDILIQRFGAEYEEYAREKSAFNPFPILFSKISIDKRG